MLEVDGMNIKGMPFEGLKPISELLSFDDDAMLIHYVDNRKSDWVAYWVDFDKNGKRWLYGKVSKEELYYYIIGNKSLRQLFKDIRSDYVFLIDCDIDETFVSAVMLNSYAIPDKYFAGKNSFYEFGINEFYKIYLNDNYYIDRLRHESVRVIAEPSDGLHGQTVSAKDAAMVLLGTAKSMEGFIDVTAFNMLKLRPHDRATINKRTNKLKEQLSPRISQNLFGSFEVWLTMDVITLDADSKEEAKWRDEIIDEYKKNVLDVDISSVEDAKLIEEKYSVEERKKIFDPLIKIYDNDNISVTITDYKNTFKKEYKNKPLSKEFKEIVIPKPTAEVEAAAAEIEETIVALIVKMKNGKNVGNLKIKDLRANLLFSELQPDLSYTISDPIDYQDKKYKLKRPIKCHYVIKGKTLQEIYNTDLEISAEGTEYDQVVELFMQQLRELISEYIKGREIGRRDSKFIELEKYIDV